MSLSNILTLLKFQLSAKFNKDKNKKVSISMILTLLVAVTVLGTVFYFLLGVVEPFNGLGLGNKLITVVILILQAMLFLLTINNKVKTLYNNNDNTFFKYIPVSELDIFISKIMVLYLSDLLFISLISVPMFIAYGIVSALGVYYYLSILFIVIMLPVLPLMLSVLVAYVIKIINNFLSNKFILKLVSTILVLGVLFYSYSELLLNITNLLGKGDYHIYVSADFVWGVSNLADKLFLQGLMSGIMFGTNVWLSLVVVTAINLGFVGIMLLFAKFAYGAIVYNERVMHGNKTIIITKNKSKSVSRSLVEHEVKTVIRSTNYAFQSFGIAITMPLMTILNALIVNSIVTNEIGSVALMGLSVYIMAQYITFKNLYLANIFSRDSDTFYIRKILPVSLNKQIFVMIIIYSLISAFSIITSTALLFAFGAINVFEFIILLVTLLVFSVGLIALNIYNDIKHFKIKTISLENDNENKDNVSRALNLGSIISLVMGVSILILSYTISSVWVLLAVLGLVLILTTLSVLRLFKKASSKIYELEIR